MNNLDHRRDPIWDGRQETFSTWKEAYTQWGVAWDKYHERKKQKRGRDPLEKPLIQRLRARVRAWTYEIISGWFPESSEIIIEAGNFASVTYFGGETVAIVKFPLARREVVEAKLRAAVKEMTELAAYAGRNPSLMYSIKKCCC